MKKAFYIFCKNYIGLLTLIAFSGSCVDYLDKAPEAEITEMEVFGDFARYQGFVEDLYQHIPDKTRGKWNLMNWNMSNDVNHTSAQTLSYYFERGNYTQWTNNTAGFFNGTTSERINNVGNEGNNANRRSGFWINGWRGIRAANIAIKNINLLQGTEEERNLILGQAHFFRAFFHFNILNAWGGVPYVDVVFEPTDKLDWPRLSYLETAQRIAEDLEIAAELLPKSWDETVAGQTTLGANAGRVTRGAAYAYLGKNWLYAASPLMNGMETGDYESYNTELAQKAADAFAKLLQLADEGYYGLHEWNRYRLNFWTMTAESLHGKEFVWGHPRNKTSRYAFGEHLLQAHGGNDNSYASVTVELMNKFGMQNGYPIDDPASGYDPAYPWTGRDPRMYYSLVLDGDKILHYTTNFPADTYAAFHIGGKHRTNVPTGIGQKKFLGEGANNKDARWNNNYHFMIPYMRLAHAYLMYAEAVNESYGGADGKSPNSTMSAVEAVNLVRKRAGVDPVPSKFLNHEAFRGVIRNEIGVEVCLEGHQWYDYRRWYIAHLSENRSKTRLDYDKEHTYFTPVQFAEITFDKGKHYWLPFTKEQAAIYLDFYQNPGW